MSPSEQQLDAALAVAHLPALVLSMVHLTGDPTWLRPEWRPSYRPLARGDIGVPEAEQAKIRAAARPVIAAHLAGQLQPAPAPEPEQVRQMMDFIAGAAIPPGYVDFLSDELALTGRS